MAVGVEFLAERLDPLHAVLFEHIDQLALGQLDAIEQRLEAFVGLGAQLVVERRHRPVHVVGNAQDVAGEAGDAVHPRIGDLALGALSHVVHVGQRPQQPILGVGQLAVERGGRLRRRDRLGLHRRIACRHGVAVGRRPGVAVVHDVRDIRADALKIKP